MSGLSAGDIAGSGVVAVGEGGMGLMGKIAVGRHSETNNNDTSPAGSESTVTAASGIELTNIGESSLSVAAASPLAPPSLPSPSPQRNFGTQIIRRRALIIGIR